MGASWGSLAAGPAAALEKRKGKKPSSIAPSAVQGVRRSGLKRPSGEKTKPAGGVLQRWWRLHTGRRVTFKGAVRVQEYARRLDGGGTVPGDGSKLTMGLGRLVRATWAPLQPAAARGVARPPVEETAWVPSNERVKLLRQAMGEVAFLQAWLRHRREVVQIRRSRALAKKDPEEQHFMPSSLAEAQTKAKALHLELRRPKHLQAMLPATPAADAEQPGTPPPPLPGKRQAEACWMVGDRPLASPMAWSTRPRKALVFDTKEGLAN